MQREPAAPTPPKVQWLLPSAGESRPMGYVRDIEGTRERGTVGRRNWPLALRMKWNYTRVSIMASGGVGVPLDIRGPQWPPNRLGSLHYKDVGFTRGQASPMQGWPSPPVGQSSVLGHCRGLLLFTMARLDKSAPVVLLAFPCYVLGGSPQQGDFPGCRDSTAGTAKGPESRAPATFTHCPVESH